MQYGVYFLFCDGVIFSRIGQAHAIQIGHVVLKLYDSPGNKHCGPSLISTVALFVLTSANWLISMSE